jgi:hypothetical protein
MEVATLSDQQGGHQNSCPVLQWNRKTHTHTNTQTNTHNTDNGSQGHRNGPGKMIGGDGKGDDEGEVTIQ